MTDKTATERLREGLTARGVEWKATVNPIGCVFTHWDSPVLGGMRIHACDNEDGTLNIFDGCDLTPEQAIAATVGAGTCRCKVEESDDYYDTYTRYHMGCGYTMYGDEFDDPPKFCAWCGGRIEVVGDAR